MTAPPRVGSCVHDGWVVSGVCGEWVILMHTPTADTRVEKWRDVTVCPCGAADRYLRTGRLR